MKIQAMRIGVLAEMAEIGIEGFAAGDREKHAAEYDQAPCSD